MRGIAAPRSFLILPERFWRLLCVHSAPNLPPQRAEAWEGILMGQWLPAAVSGR